MVTSYTPGEMLPMYTRHATANPSGMLQPMPAHVSQQLAMQTAGVMVDQQQKRSPLLCGYPSKKCWSWRVEKRNGELHKFCEYHRQKANTNQRRMEQRRKQGQQGRTASPRAKSSSRRSPKVSSQTQREVVKVERPTAVKSVVVHSTHVKSMMVPASNSGSPRSIDGFSDGVDEAAIYSWMDAELDIGIGMDAAVEYMMVDGAAIDMEPSDKPVDLYEEDLFFLEHFIDEISHSIIVLS
ncbi:hypothetical protein BBJ29_007917 [Phytophthora kernoviae]|uniref:Uncharacterized protein n=1 Tax=Phytophthora kernoviae TaxID=325452 RepID=A0A3F2RMW3_9STRA|nr:hypothetical protein BBJ29_007917 [Phytophthora kernoviae]RLN60756.1 hypothetical protein BBP00_00005795 [Phytophthora kernoviae]